MDIPPEMAPEKIRHEVVDSKKRLEEQIQKEVSVFCWRSGEEYRKMGYTHKYFEEAGYRYVVSNLKLEKIR